MKTRCHGGEGTQQVENSLPRGRGDTVRSKLAATSSAKKTPPGTFGPGRSSLAEVGQQISDRPIDHSSLGSNRAAHRHDLAPGLLRSRRIGGRGRSNSRRRVAGIAGTAGRLGTAAGLAAAGAAVGLAAARLVATALLRLVDGLEQVKDPVLLLAATSRSTAARLAAAVASVAGRLCTAVAGSASRFRTAIPSTAGRLAAAVSGVARRLAAAIRTALMPLLAGKQPLQTTEEVMLLLQAAPGGAAARLAATSTSVAGRLCTAVAGSASRFRTAIASTAAGLAASIASTATGLAASIAGVAAGLAARGATLVSEHLVEQFKTKRLTTDGNAKNQRTEEQHTLHRATSPLLVNHARVFVPNARHGRPEVVIHELSCGRPVEPFRDSRSLQVVAAPWLPDGHSDAPGDKGAIGGRGKLA